MKDISIYRVKQFYTIAGIIFLSFLVVLSIGWETKAIYEIPKSVFDATMSSASPEHSDVGQALSLLNTGTFNNRGVGSIGAQRGPVHPFLIATVFFLLGPYVGAIYIMNYIFLVLSLVLVWRISSLYFNHPWQYIPSLMLAIFLGAVARVWIVSYEMLVLFLATLSLWSFFRYSDTQRLSWFFVWVGTLTLWVLEKPIMLYFAFVILPYLFLWYWRTIPVRKRLVHITLATIILTLGVGSWSLRNRQVLGTWQLGTGGSVILRSTTLVDFSPYELTSLAISFSLGDYIGSKLYRYYPKDASPLAWDPEITERDYQKGWLVKDKDGSLITRTELNKRMYNEAISNIKRRPTKFMLTGFIRLLRLNAPVNHHGEEIIRLFVGTHDTLSSWMKIAVILFVRGVWFIFLSIVLYAMLIRCQKWRSWGLLILLILYYNAMHALLTHAEPRYILTLMPLYFIFFTEGMRVLTRRYFARLL